MPSCQTLSNALEIPLISVRQWWQYFYKFHVQFTVIVKHRSHLVLSQTNSGE